MAASVFANMRCSLSIPNIPTDWIDVHNDCLSAVRTQIQKEIDVSYHYLAMGAHFSRDTVNRPGLAEVFFLFAKEERQEASKLIEYLSTSGHLTNDISDLIRTPLIKKDEWSNAAEALEYALQMETDQSKSIRRVIAQCERRNNQYTMVNKLIGEFLESQVQDQHNLAKKLTNLKKMMINHGALGEFLFDKDLLNKIYYVNNSF